MQNEKSKPLFLVEGTFEITERGLVLVPGLKEDSPQVAVGDTIVIMTPTNNIVRTKIAGIEMIKFHTVPKEKMIPILLPYEIKKEDIPIGTSVYLNSEY